MIKVEVKRNKEMYYFLNVSGHANFDDHGKDIVCAAVSVLAQTLLESIAEVAELQDFKYEVKSGYIRCNLLNSILDEQKMFIINILFKMFVTGINGVKESYPEYLEFKVKEVASCDD